MMTSRFPRFRTILGGRASPTPPGSGSTAEGGSGFFVTRGQGVGAAARLAGVRVIDGGHPVAVELEFRLPRPPGHLRRDGSLRVAYLYVAARGTHADELAGPLLDGLTGIAWADRGQVADLHVRKLYAADDAAVGVHVRIREVRDP